jgi:hypothetical protein
MIVTRAALSIRVGVGRFYVHETGSGLDAILPTSTRPASQPLDQ